MPITTALQLSIQKCEEALAALVMVKGFLSNSASLDTGTVKEKLKEARENAEEMLAHIENTEVFFDLYGPPIRKFATHQTLFCDVTR